MKLFYRKFGDGPPLIILHGLFGSSDNWVTIAKQLGHNCTVILPDQRNHGQSPHSVIHDYDSMRDDLYELVTDLKLKKFFLAGHSMGGKTAIAFAIKWPEMLNGLVVADVSPFTGERTTVTAYTQYITILRTILSIDISSIRSRGQVESLLLEKISSEKIRALILKNLQRNDGDRFTWKMDPASLYNNIENLMAGIDMSEAINHPVTGFPVIFLKGSESDYLSLSDMAQIKKVFPAAELTEIKGAGHWIHADRPEEVILQIRKFLSDV
jgi:pimeloyl-ACP methyl ester carboxylesterase